MNTTIACHVGTGALIGALATIVAIEALKLRTHRPLKPATPTLAPAFERAEQIVRDAAREAGAS